MEVFGNLDLNNGQLQNARQQNYSGLPAFTVGRDEGRIIYVSVGSSRGYWFGAEDGTNSFSKLNLGTILAQYSVSAQTIANGVTYQSALVSTTNGAQKGLIGSVTLSAAVATSGKVLVEFFNDLGRTDRVYANYFDLASPTTLKDNVTAYFSLDNIAGDLYVDIANQTGSSDDFTLTIEAPGVLLTPSAAPPGDGSGINSGVAGDGIAYNSGTAELEVDLLTNSGLQLTGAAGSRELSLLAAPGGGLTTGAGGSSVDATVVKTTGDHSIAGKITHTNGSVTLTPVGTSGPPVAGTWGRGTFYVDTNDDVWYCLTGGTPGTWTFWGWKIVTLGGDLAGTSYTSTVVAGASVDVTLAVTGRRGVLRKANFWVSDATFAVATIDIPYRVSCYPDENLYGREAIWFVQGQGRKTYMTNTAAAGTNNIEVHSVNVGEPDDLVRIRQATGVAEENQRITVRNTTPPVDFTLDENLDNTLAVNDNIMLITEFGELPWYNTSAVPANYEKLYLRFHNDHSATTCQFGYELWVESLGGGQPL